MSHTTRSSIVHTLASITAMLLSGVPAVYGEQLPALAAVLYAAAEDAAAVDERYRAGRDALDEGRWSAAAELFAAVAGDGGDNADAAHYWRGYALYKDSRPADARAAFTQLRRSYPDSSWLDDGRALELEIRQQSGSARGPEADDDEELMLLALNGLMHSDSERALPMLRKFIEGDHSQKLRQRALFVLSQSSSAEAAELLLEVAKGGRHQDLQLRAVHYLGISDGPGARQALAEIYRSATDRKVKSAVLHGFMVADATAPLLELARTEPDEKLRRDAIHQLGVMDATDALRQLYEAESSTVVKEQILHSLFIADDTETLLRVARTEADENLRRVAIRGLGLIGSEESAAALVEMYGQVQDTETRGAIIQALFLSDDADELIRIARTESDLELRKQAVQRLSLMDDSEAALDFLIEILDN